MDKLRILTDRKTLARSEKSILVGLTTLTSLKSPLDSDSFSANKVEDFVTDSRSSKAEIRGAVLATQLISICFGLVLPPLGGFWLDQRWGCLPWLLIVGLILGFTSAGFQAIALFRNVTKESHERNK